MQDENDKRSGEDRRDSAISHHDIMDAVKENTARIDRLETKVDDMAVPQDWEEMLRDVAAVGRTGRIITRITKWGAPIVAAFWAAWHYITNGFNHPPGH